MMCSGPSAVIVKVNLCHLHGHLTVAALDSPTSWRKHVKGTKSLLVTHE